MATMMDLGESIRLSTSVHENLLTSLDPEIVQDIDAGDAFFRWISQNSDGFYIRDLDHIIQIMDKLEEMVVTDACDAMLILEKFLEICSVPVMELKANERLSVRGFAQIKRFFARLAQLWSAGNSLCKIKIGKCFRCIAHGGKDPTVLRSLQREWVADGYRQRVTDTGFLIKCLRESGALEVLVFEFALVSDLLDYSAGLQNDEIGTNSKVATEAEEESQLAEAEAAVSPPQGERVYKNEYDDPEFYGVPKSFLNRHAVVEPPPQEEILPEPEKNEPEPQEGLEDGEPAEGEEGGAEGEGADQDGGDGPAADAPVEEANSEAPQISAELSKSRDGVVQDGEGLAVDAGGEAGEDGEGLIPGEGELQEGAGEAEVPPVELEPEEVPLAIDTAPEEEEQPGPSAEGTPKAKSASTQEPQNGPSVLRELSQVLLNLCLDLSVDLPCALLMCERGLCDGAVVLIEKDFKLNPSDPRIAQVIELIWNVLEPFLEQFKAQGASPDEVRQRLSNYSDNVVDFGRAVEVMQSLISYTMHLGFRQADKELRNEVLIILTMLAQFPCAVGYFLQSGLFHLLLTYACVEEAGADSWGGFCTDIGKYRNFATVSDIDLEFKKELWFVLAELLRSNDPEALEIFSSSPLQATLLQYMEHDSFDPHKRNNDHATAAATEGFNMSASMNMSRDDTMLSRSMAEERHEQKPHRLKASTVANAKAMSAARNTFRGRKEFISQLPLSKLREFQLLAVAFLLNNAPRVLSTFEALDGPVRVISLTLQYCQSDVPDHKMLIFYCLILLQRSVVQSTAVRAFMEQNNLIQSFLYVYHKSEKVETQAQALRLIATLCANDNRPMQMLFSQLGGIADLVSLLSNYGRKRPPLAGTKAGLKLTLKGDAELPDPLENPYGGEISVLVIAVLDCLLNGVVGNPISEALFADMEGVDVLLDLMETSPFVLRLQVLRFLSDILVNRKLMIYVNAWRSPKTLRSAGQILCHCWMDEEARVVGEKRTDGIISDLSHPLGHQEVAVSPHASETTGDFPSPRGSQASSSIGNYFQEVANNATNSITVSKLATAILAGRNATQTNLPIDICTAALERDSRVLIASILDSLGVFELYGIQQGGKGSSVLRNREEGDADINASASMFEYNASMASAHPDFDASSPASPPYNSKQVNFDHTEEMQHGSANLRGHSESKTIEAAIATLHPVDNVLGLAPADMQVLSMAKLYAALREAEWWQAVQRSALEADVEPIEADLALAEARLEHSRIAAAAVQAEQLAFYAENERIKKEGEEEFIDQIITKKNQQIKAEWLKKNGTKLVARGPTKVSKKSKDNLVS